MTQNGDKMTQNDESIVLNKPTDEEDFDGVSASFTRFEDIEEGSFQQFKNEKESEQ